MRSYMFAAAAATAIALASSGAGAVDIENQDGKELKVTVFPQESSSVTFTMKPGEKKSDACGKTLCEVMLGDSSGDWVAASTTGARVIIKDGKLHLSN